MGNLFVRRPIPTTLFQITPQFASGSEGHTAVDAFVRSDHGEDLGVVIEDHEASPTSGSAIACVHPFHFHDTSDLSAMRSRADDCNRPPSRPGNRPFTHI